MSQIQDDWRTANTQLKGVKDATDTAWASLRTNVETPFTDLESAVSKAESEVAAH